MNFDDPEENAASARLLDSMKDESGNVVMGDSMSPSNGSYGLAKGAEADGAEYHWCNRCNKASHWTGEDCPLCGAKQEQGEPLLDPHKCPDGHIFDAHGSDEGDPDVCPKCGKKGETLAKISKGRIVFLTKSKGYIHPQYDLDFLDDLKRAKEGQVAGTVGDLVHGAKTREAMHEALHLPIMALNSVVENGKRVPLPDHEFKGALGSYRGRPHIFINNTPRHMSTDVIHTILHEVGHHLHAVRGEGPITKQSAAYAQSRAYENDPEEHAAEAYVDHFRSLGAQEEEHQGPYLSKAIDKRDKGATSSMDFDAPPPPKPVAAPSARPARAPRTPRPKSLGKENPDGLAFSLALREKAIHPLRHEVAYIFDKNGRFQSSHSDNHASHVAFTDKDTDDIRNIPGGGVMTHNHPLGWGFPEGHVRHQGTSFSPEDIDFAHYHSLREVRAVTPTHTYSMMPPKGQERFSQHRMQHVHDIAYRHHQALLDENGFKIVRGQMTTEQAEASHHHELWTRVAKDTGMRYSRVAHEHKGYKDHGND